MQPVGGIGHFDSLALQVFGGLTEGVCIMAVAFQQGIGLQRVGTPEKMAFFKVLYADDICTHGVKIADVVQVQDRYQFQQGVIIFLPVAAVRVFQAAVAHVHHDRLAQELKKQLSG